MAFGNTVSFLNSLLKSPLYVMARDRAQQRVLQYQQTLVSIAGQRDCFFIAKRAVLSAEVRTMIE